MQADLESFRLFLPVPQRDHRYYQQKALYAFRQAAETVRTKWLRILSAPMHFVFCAQ